MRPFYLCGGNYYTGKMAFLYQDGLNNTFKNFVTQIATWSLNPCCPPNKASQKISEYTKKCLDFLQVTNRVVNASILYGEDIYISMGYCKKDITPLLTHWSSFTNRLILTVAIIITQSVIIYYYIQLSTAPEMVQKLCIQITNNISCFTLMEKIDCFILGQCCISKTSSGQKWLIRLLSIAGNPKDHNLSQSNHL